MRGRNASEKLTIILLKLKKYCVSLQLLKNRVVAQAVLQKEEEEMHLKN
jgi:hypothetical protein